MSKLSVRNLEELAASPREEIEGYGGKTFGVVLLRQMRSASPVAYEVPPGFAVPGRSRGSYGGEDIRRELDALIRGVSGRTVLMARSSALSEDHEPGKNPTYLSTYDPADPEKGTAGLTKNIERLLDVSPDMGVLVMPIVGQAETIQDEQGNRRNVIGHNNVSFYGTTHSPFHAAQALFSVVSGLGHLAAFHSDQSIPIIAVRESGNLVFIGNMSDKRARHLEVPEVKTHQDYRQSKLVAYDFGQADVAEFSTLGIFEGLKTLIGYMGDGAVHGRYLSYFTEGDKEAKKKAWEQFCTLAQAHGSEIKDVVRFKTPFWHSDLLRNLVHLSRYFGQGHPLQFEGAFVPASGNVPYLYQLLPLPSQSAVMKPIDLDPIHLATDECFGLIDYSAPLVLAEIFDEDHHFLHSLAEIDRRYSATGYTLLAPVHYEEVLAATPHCRVRLSCLPQAMSSHPLTALWLKHTKEEPGNFAMGSGLMGNPQLHFCNDPTISGIPPDVSDKTLGIHIFENVRVQANGEVLALQVVKPPSSPLLEGSDVADENYEPVGESAESIIEEDDISSTLYPSNYAWTLGGGAAMTMVRSPVSLVIAR